MSAPATQNAQEALLWVKAGYGQARFAHAEIGWSSRLFRLGVWWKHRGAETPAFVEEISDRVVLINRHVLVVDQVGDVISCFEFVAPQERLASSLN